MAKLTLKKLLENKISIYQDLVNRYPNNKQHLAVLNTLLEIWNLCIDRERF